MHLLQQVLWVSVTGGYFLLLNELWRTGSFWLCPFFSSYVLALCLYYPFWDPRFPLVVVEPILIGLKVAAVIEAYLLASRRVSSSEKRALFILLVAIASAGVLASLGFLRGYRAYRQYAHIGIALGSCFGVLAMWVHPPIIWPRVKAHGMILALLMLNFAVTGFLPRSTMNEWLQTNCIFFSVSVLCVALWLTVGLLIPEPVNLNTKLPDLIV